MPFIVPKVMYNMRALVSRQTERDLRNRLTWLWIWGLVGLKSLTLWDPMDYTVHRILQANIGMGSLSLLYGIFPNQVLNPGIPYYRQIFYQLSHNRSQRILEWVAYLFSSGSSQPRNQTRVSCIAGRFFTNWAIRKGSRLQIQVNTLMFTMELLTIVKRWQQLKY